MPTYSYRCTACSNAFDVQQAFTDASSGKGSGDSGSSGGSSSGGSSSGGSSSSDSGSKTSTPAAAAS